MEAAYYDGNRTIRVGRSERRPPEPDEVRIEVAYAGVCGSDLHLFLGHMDDRVTIPQVIGHEMSGTIAEIGREVTGWEVGDRVVVRPLDPCGECPACQAGHSHVCQNLKILGIETPGAFQASWTVPAHTLHRLPEAVPLDLGALVEPVAVACHDVRLAEVRAGETVVVIGGGPIGMLNGLVARHIGADVAIIEINPYRIDLARSLGFEAIHPNETDPIEWTERRTDGAGADVVFEVSGSAAGARMMTDLARVRGRIVVVAIFAETPSVDLFRLFWREQRMRGARVYEPEDFERAISLVAERVLPLEALVTARRPLSRLQETFEQMASGADIMKVLLVLNSGE